jgi:hypothetical protein
MNKKHKFYFYRQQLGQDNITMPKFSQPKPVA